MILKMPLVFRININILLIYIIIPCMIYIDHIGSGSERPRRNEEQL